MKKQSSQRLSKISNWLAAPETHFYGFFSFLIIVFFTGGGSRDDIQSLIILRPLAVLFCAYALTVKAPEQWKGRMAPLYIAAALLVLMLLQLIPLPPSIWTELPGRQIFVEIADLAGIDQPWRPLTLSPSKTLNSLFSLTVPIAAMMLYLNLDRQYRKQAVPVIIILCAISALWAIFQVMGSPRGPLYTYRITNFGIGVGLFANRNHQAVTLAATIVMLGWYAGSLTPTFKKAGLKFYASIATILVLVPLIFITGSRAGLILMALSLILALFLIYFGKYFDQPTSQNRSSSSLKIKFLSRRQIILVLGTLAIASILALSIFLSRSLAFDRLFSGAEIEELRLKLLPTLFAMSKDYMPLGAGFGSFEHVYKIYEPFELLNYNYLNQAHNDWLQYIIDGGMPAILIAIFALLWLAVRTWGLARSWRTPDPAKYRALMCLLILLFFLAASIGDYPLRIPSIISIFAILACHFNDEIRSVQKRDINSR